jgi:NAD/NADP transhydrogenase beta subunit
VTIFVSVIVTFLHSFNYGSIDLLLVAMLVVGSIIGVQIGQKLGERIDSSGLRALLAILLLVVGIAIAYETFFAEHSLTEISNVSNLDLNFFSKFIKEFSNDMPFFYGLFSIMFAIFLGVGAAFIRRFLSNFKKKMLMKS